MTLRIMLDIETLSTHNSNAVVLSVGAVPWSQNKAGVIFNPSRLWVLSLRDQFARGRTTMDSTIKWWQSQSDAARKHWHYPEERPVEIGTFAQEFGQWFPSDAEAWANGIVFDLGNLATLLGVTPWKYNAAADARTMYRHTTQFRQRPLDAIDVGAHDPIVDCKNQIWGVWEHWPEDDLANSGSGGQVPACTCHPDDKPPVPCARRYALDECRRAALLQNVPQPHEF